MDNKPIIKTIGQLEGRRFYVPSYQRGYRWTEHEVMALLNDVAEFSTEGDKSYCIQPLIVKTREDGSFEVVDGQQRLTTIYIFMKIAEEKTDYLPFEMEFETRANSQNFLSALAPKGTIDKDNIDYYHITTARNTINNWLDGKKNRYIALNDLFKKFIESVFFIWHEIAAHIDPIEMFTQVNLGKIPLTNAELIKALVLNKENFKNDDSTKDFNQRQTEISIAWDRIEQGLRDDSFWYFLNDKERTGTRIDMLFEMLANEQNAIFDTPIDSRQHYYPFLVFSIALNDSENMEKFVMELWDRVEKLYAEFQEWYSDLDKFHVIGYLIATGTRIEEIVKMTRGKRKSEVNKELLMYAQKKAGKTDKETLEKISYDTTDKKKIRNILLLFNLSTLVCKSEKQYRFPFDIYKGETKNSLKWDIEHIHATADETDDPDNSLQNLTLLESGTNRSPLYSDKPFDEKRKVILDRESKGLFVPLCTKNVFLKTYSSNLDNMTIWNEHDKVDYFMAMVKTFETFFEGAN